MKTNLKISKISLEAMLEREEKSYNPTVWKQNVTSYSKYPRYQFYVIEPDSHYSYARFYVSYIADKIYFFSEFHAFSACLTNRGFCKVSIDAEGNVEKTLFVDSKGNEGYAENIKSNRSFFANRLTPAGIMVSSCL